MKQRGKNPLFKKQLSEKTKELWKNKEYRDKLSKALKGRKMQPININGIKYKSLREASVNLNLSRSAIKRRLYSDNPIFSNYVKPN